MAGDEFQRVNSVDHAVLLAQNIIVPVTVAGDNKTLVFISSTDANGETSSHLAPIDTDVLNGYSGQNIVPLSTFSASGENTFQTAVIGAAARMVGIDPEVLEGDSITILNEAVLPALKEFRLNANNAQDGGTVDLNDPEHRAMFENIDSLVNQAEIAAALPLYGVDLHGELENIDHEEFGIDPYDIGQALEIMNDDTMPAPPKPPVVLGPNDA